MTLGIARAAGDVEQRTPDPPDHRPRDPQEYDCLGEVLRAEAHAEGTTAPSAPSLRHLPTRIGTVACVVSQRMASTREPLRAGSIAIVNCSTGSLSVATFIWVRPTSCVLS